MARIPLPADMAGGYAIQRKLDASRAEFEKRLVEIKARLDEMEARLRAQEERRGPGRPPKY